MRILWLTMQALPEIHQKLNPDMPFPPTGGWMEGISRQIISNNAKDFIYCYPDKIGGLSGEVNGYRYYTIRKIQDFKKFDDNDLKVIMDIFEKEKPDIIHLFGTEHSHQTQMVHIINKLGYIDKLIIWIQGMVSVYPLHYDAGLSEKIIRHRTLKEFLLRNNISDLKKNMILRGLEEVEALKIARHVFVRTDWDEAACKMINPNLYIHKCNETLRPAFYDGKCWNINNIKRHSIFISQSNYPIKGFHMLLKAVSIIKKEFPDVSIRTTGKDYFHYVKLKDKLRISTYQKLLIEIAERYELLDSIYCLGTLNEKQMRDEYLKANVYVSPASIENSPNSLGEAMILGVPIVASNVGGIKNMLFDGTEGLLYPFDEPYVLAEYICRIFRDDEKALYLSKNAINHALKTHNSEVNYKQLMREYKKVIDQVNDSTYDSYK